MADQKPPRLVDDERATVLALLQYQRDSVVRKVEGVTDDVARTSPVTSGTSLLWLITHLADAERLWILERFAGETIDPLDERDTMAKAIAAYRATWARTDAVVAASELDEPCRNLGDDSPVNLRWVLMHLLEETARHAGHADILRELVDGQTGR